MLKLNTVHNMDCIEGLKQLPDNSVDSIITDPPYELGFMNKGWDSTGIAYNIEMWEECLRVLKHGGHLLSFGGTRTYHRMACAIEDAGFEIRDQIQWIYGSGFPKSHNISKAIDKRVGAKREVIGRSNSKGIRSGAGNYIGDDYKQKGYDITAPSSDLAIQWDGWGTALKPAHEPIVMARKPLSEKTVVDNVLKWGTGGINIDECRVEYANESDLNTVKAKCNFTENSKSIGFGDGEIYGTGSTPLEQARSTVRSEGRFPANVILDEGAGRLLDGQSGTTTSAKVKIKKEAYDGESNTGFLRGVSTPDNQYSDTGGASRFFYCAKASKKERGEGNNHPTVKPIKLMEYLVTLVTPKGGVVLDPFTGSGTTLLAAKNLGFDYIGFEMEEEYIKIIEKRLA